MKKSSDFENILDECLEQLIKGGTVEQCLESYPERVLELEPLLRTVQATVNDSPENPEASGTIDSTIRSGHSVTAGGGGIPITSIARAL